MKINIRENLRKYMRVMQVARKPSRDEFTSTSKICIAGIFVIGLIGFGIFLGFILSGL